MKSKKLFLIRVMVDENREMIGVHFLDPSLFNQPEAISFDQNGTLYIGNEGGDKTRKGTLSIFNLIP